MAGFLVRATLCRCHAPVILHRDQHHRLDPLAERSGWRCLAGAPDANQSLFPLVALCRRRGRRLRLLLHTFTNAGPRLDSLILTFSVLAQFMLMGRRIENWYVWLAVNTLAVPLYMTRGLNLTAGLYFLFWINARHGLYQWRKELRVS